MEPTGKDQDHAGLPAQGGQPIGVVRNPRSHRNRSARDDVAAYPDVLLAAPASKDGLAAELERLQRADLGLLVIDGGDGTVRDVLSRGYALFADRWPPLMILPKGKTNALAVDLGMPGKLSLDEAVARLPGARRVTRTPLLIECLEAERPPVLGFIMGTGVFSTAIDAGQVAHRFGAFQGVAVALTTGFGIVQALFGFGRSPWRQLSRHAIRLGPEGRTLPSLSSSDAAEQRFAAGLSTLGSFPIGLRPFADEPGPIRYIVFDRPLRRAMALAPAILMGMDRPILERLGIHRGSAEQVNLDLGSRFILDGEAYPPGRWRVRLGPELTFLVP